MDMIVDCALEYRRFGWSIIPLTPNSKRPYSELLRTCTGDPGWKRFMNVAASEDEIRSWFEIDPASGIGVVLGQVSGLVVADFDRGEWPELETPMVRTSRGVHLYLAASGEVPGRGLAWGELKGEGGMVVAPPSVHESGHVYEWLVAPQTGLVAFEDVIDQLQIPPKGSARKVSTATRSRLSVVPNENVPVLRLTPEESEYLRLRPAKGQRQSLGFGEIEHGIICSMANQGYSASEILAWFVAENPPKFEERGMEWLMFSIENAIIDAGSILTP